jgi:hypothetical protein
MKRRKKLIQTKMVKEGKMTVIPKVFLTLFLYDGQYIKFVTTYNNFSSSPPGLLPLYFDLSNASLPFYRYKIRDSPNNMVLHFVVAGASSKVLDEGKRASTKDTNKNEGKQKEGREGWK